MSIVGCERGLTAVPLKRYTEEHKRRLESAYSPGFRLGEKNYKPRGNHATSGKVQERRNQLRR
jgi:hypothetical protein